MATRFTGAAERRRWFPSGRVEITSATPVRSASGTWKPGARIGSGFYGRGADKSPLATRIGRLAPEAGARGPGPAWKSPRRRPRGPLGRG